MDGDNISDAKTIAHTPPADLTTQVLIQIRDSLSLISREQRETSKEVTDIKMKVVRLEERDERVKRVEETVAEIKGAVEALKTDKAQRDGASRVFVGIRGWLPVLIAVGAAVASIFSAVYLGGRSAGVIGAPPSHVEHKL